jgi:hypothetical protein
LEGVSINDVGVVSSEMEELLEVLRLVVTNGILFEEVGGIILVFPEHEVVDGVSDPPELLKLTLSDG